MVHWNYKQENKNREKAQIADAYEALQDAPATVLRLYNLYCTFAHLAPTAIGRFRNRIVYIYILIKVMLLGLDYLRSISTSSIASIVLF